MRGIVVDADARPLRHVLSATAWVVLEEVALVVEQDDERGLVAATSARQVAEVLGIDAGTAAGALRQLRQRGLLTLDRHPGPTGRFGLSVYSLVLPSGLVVLSPCGDLPHVDIPHQATAVAPVGPTARPAVSEHPAVSDHPALNLRWADR